MNRVSTTNLESVLSKSERRIARLLAWGFTQKEIADKLFLSQLTVSTHMKNIYRKLDIHKETDLCRWWIFYEYCIADNPLKKIVTVFFIVLCTSMILADQNAVRTFRCRQITKSISAKPARVRRSVNVFTLQPILTA